MKRWMLVTVAVMALAACDSVKSRPLPSSADDPALREIGQGLDDDDKKLLIGYLARREMAKVLGGTSLPDQAKTVGDAIAAQKTWLGKMTDDERKAEALKVEVQQKRKAIADEIGKTVTVAFLNAHFEPSSFESGRYQDEEYLTFAVHNQGTKPLKALKGEAIFIDTFGDEFVRVPMQFEEAIAPGEKTTVDLSMEINKFIDEHKRVMQFDETKKFRFEPGQIVFQDGSTLRAPEAVE